MRRLILGAALLLGACVSTEMRPYVGRDISEVFMAYGRPEQVIPLPDGRQAFQYRRNEGAAVLPGSASTRITASGDTAWVNTTASPGMVVEMEGCLLTFIASPAGDSWTVTDIRVPRQLVC